MYEHLSRFGAVSAPCLSAAPGTPPWLQVTQAIGAAATTIGVLIALYVAVIRDPRQASEEQRHHMAQVDALHRAATERFGAQARKLVPSCTRTPMLGETWWAVRIDNASHKMTTILGVEVTAIDARGAEVRGGCTPVTDILSVDPAVDHAVRTALSESLQATLGHPLPGTVRQAIRDAVAVHFVHEWPHTLPPNQHAVMCYTASDPGFELRVTVEYEDEAGFQWRRTDTGQPRRTNDPDDISPLAAWEQ
jgi:hypothetical protein